MKKDNIPGYPGHYLNRKGTLWRFKNGEWIKVKRYISPKGYPHVHLYNVKTKRSHIKRLNRLVATLYIPNPGKFTLKELSTKFNCKNMSRIVRRVKGEVVK